MGAAFFSNPLLASLMLAAAAAGVAAGLVALAAILRRRERGQTPQALADAVGQLCRRSVP